MASLLGTVRAVVLGGALMIGFAASWSRLFPELAHLGRLDELEPRAGVGSLDVRAARPVDASGRTTTRRARRLLLPALRQSDGRGGRSRAGRARRRHRAPLPVRRGRDDGARPVAARAGRHDRARRAAATTAPVSRSPRSRRWGLRVVEFDQTGPPPEDVQLVWLEAPSNPYLTMPDLEAAAAHPAPVVVDATVATPVHLRPLEHGADFVLHSATKYLAGHDDALLGAVVCRDDAAAEELRTFRSRTGIVAAPDPAWLLLRGLKTLELRVRRQTETAALLAERLRAHPAVETVRYPGLGGLLSFDVADAETARKVETSTRVIVNASLARRRDEPDREPPPLGGRPRPARPAPRSAPGSRIPRRSGPTSSRRSASGVHARAATGSDASRWPMPFRILVAEDDESFLDTIALLLEQDAASSSPGGRATGERRSRSREGRARRRRAGHRDARARRRRGREALRARRRSSRSSP